MNEKQNPVIRKYFAATNSFNGFISFFDQIFNSELYETLFIKLLFPVPGPPFKT